MTTAHNERLLVFIGSYSEAADEGLHVCELDETTGEMTVLSSVAGLRNPTFLNVDPDRLMLYAIGERENDKGETIGEAAAFAVDPKTGKLTERGRAATVGAPTCHIQRDHSDRFLAVVSYHGGQVGLSALTEDGNIGELLDWHQHAGGGRDPVRQEGPHPHSAFFSPDNRFMFVPDLGKDAVVAYALDAAAGKLRPHGETALHPGAGPRHMAFHPSGKFAYVINELDSTVTAFRYEAETGTLHTIETVSTLPADFTGDSWCAEVVVSRDGRFLYGSNRGHDSIAVFSIDAESGRLTPVEHVSTQGGHPRHFALTPSGGMLIAANRDADNVVTFRIDQTTGRLTPTGRTLSLPKPVCVQPFVFPF